MIVTGNIYIASVNENKNWCKIGYTTKKPEERIRELKRCYPGYGFSPFWSKQVSLPTKRESMLKRFFQDRSISGEMFSVSPQEALDAAIYIGDRDFFVPWPNYVRSMCSFNPCCEPERDYFFHLCMRNKKRFLHVSRRYFDLFDVRVFRDVDVDHFAKYVMEHIK